ncbi:MAG: T9SS type A sorting domain-containing protein [Bacteroidales bacterium]|nr:T9SS type A sorting domain-containing protein [Bacteroidales bacterium]
MKKIILKLCLLYLMITASPSMSQNVAFENLDINNVNARINSNNNLFWDFIGHPRFEVPKGSNHHTVFTSTLWLAGLDSVDTLHCAAERYRQVGGDFFQGPVSDTYDSAYDVTWNKAWKLNITDIDYHKANYGKPGYIPIDAIATWPGNGNTILGQAQDLAPYFDFDGDGYYNPMAGDYPLILGDQAIFYIINDDRKVHSESKGNKLRIEIHCMAYAYSCLDSVYHNTIFLNYKIFNRSSNTYHDTYIGHWVDFDIGGAYDDYIGCDVQRGSFFGYNGDNQDTPAGGQLAYDKPPPAEAVVVLAGPYMDPNGKDDKWDYNNLPSISDPAWNGINGNGFGDSIIDNERLGLCGFFSFNNTSAPIGDPVNAAEYYNYLKGYWRESIRMQYGGDGHDGTCGPETNFIYPCDSDPYHWGTGGKTPNCNPNDWYEETLGNVPYDRRGLGSMGPFTFQSNSVQQVDLAYVFARNFNDTDNYASVITVKQRIDTLRKHFSDSLVSPCQSNAGVKEIKNKFSKENFSLYPNPADNEITVELKDAEKSDLISIYDCSGKLVLTKQINGSKNIISIKNFVSGIYFVKITSGNKVFSKRLVKLD